jgi:hypothetical protein
MRWSEIVLIVLVAAFGNLVVLEEFRAHLKRKRDARDWRSLENQRLRNSAVGGKRET